MDHDPGVRPGEATPRLASGEQERAHAHGHAHAHGGNRCLDRQHGVVDSHAVVNRAAGTVDVEDDFFGWILYVQ